MAVDLGLWYFGSAFKEAYVLCGPMLGALTVIPLNASLLCWWWPVLWDCVHFYRLGSQFEWIQ